MLTGFLTQSGARIVAGTDVSGMTTIGASATGEPAAVELDDRETAHLAWLLLAALKARGADIRGTLLDELHAAARRLGPRTQATNHSRAADGSWNLDLFRAADGAS